MQALAGLYTNASSPAAIPLVGVDCRAVISGFSSEVTLRQRFRNTEPNPIEAVYVFPLPTEAAVCGFVAERDGVRIEGRIEAREKAFETYDDALADGHGAFLLDQERPNIFTVSVGNLPPHAEVTLELRWVAPLDLEGDTLRFMLPTTVSPRYAPRAAIAEVGQPDRERVNPDRLPSVPYGLRLAVEVTSPALRVESPSHPIRTTLPTPAAPALLVELAQDDVALDRDVVLLVTPASSGPAVSVGRLENDRFLELAFVPRIESDAGGVDVVFVVDCSGSMEGSSIDEARRALALCIRALDERDTFDIVRFGSTHQSLFGQRTPFTKDSFARAMAFVDATHASMGGTEILAPLQHIFQRPAPLDPTSHKTTNVLLLTDGQVSNEAAVIQLAEAYRNRFRVFSFGIGAGVSEHLVKDVARVSRGRCELIAPGERIEPKVLRQFGRLRTPTLENIAIDWGSLVVDAAPRELPPVFVGEPLVVRAQVRSGLPSGSVALVLDGVRHEVALTATDLENATPGPVPAMWARARIRDLEAGSGRRGSSQERAGQARNDRAERQLLEVARRHSLMCSVASFVAVELRAESAKTFDPVLRKVPVALTAGWGGAGAPAPQAKRSRAGAPAGFAPPASPAPASPAPASQAPAPVTGQRLARPSAASYDAMPEEAAPARRARPSMAPPPAPPAPRSTDTIYELLALQEVDGSFPERALAVLVIHLPDLAPLIAQYGAPAVITAAVLFVLDRDHRARKDEWRAAADKARRFLDRFEPIDVAAVL